MFKLMLSFVLMLVCYNSVQADYLVTEYFMRGGVRWVRTKIVHTVGGPPVILPQKHKPTYFYNTQSQNCAT